MYKSGMDMDLSELVDFHEMLGRVGGMQQKYVTQAAKAASKVVYAAVLNAAPEGETGHLKSAIISVGERSKKKGRKFYQTTYSRDANSVLQRKIKNPGAAGGKNAKAYYPASVEYGFLTRANEGGGLSYVRRQTGIALEKVEGTHFMQRAADSVGPTAERIMKEALMKRLEREWKKKK